MADRVAYLKSISNDHRLLLLENSEALLYTPENEHFGIVPVEAMHMRCIVFARKSGGPLESIDDGRTGFLLDEKPETWAQMMDKISQIDKEAVRDAG